MNPNVVLIDEDDNFLGIEEKMKAHRLGLLHRAFSIVIFNSRGEMLIHKRASTKYHCPGLWTNACCSHQDNERSLIECANERLQEEMGMECSDLNQAFKFAYRKEFDNGLIENEVDTVLVGYSDDLPEPDPNEVEGYLYIGLDRLYEDIKSNPERYTFWFRTIMGHEEFKIFLKRYQNSLW